MTTMLNDDGVTFADGSVMNSASQLGFRNKIINGKMEIAQRGLTHVSSATLGLVTYGLDRWFTAQLGVQSAYDVSSQATTLPEFPSAIRCQKRSGSSGASVNYLGQQIEYVNFRDIRGKVATLSFYAKCGANYSGSQLGVVVFSGTATDQGSSGGINNTLTGQNTVLNTSVAVSSAYQLFEVNINVPVDAKTLQLLFSEFTTGTSGVDDWFEVTGVQLEVGSVATPFEHRLYGQELALCRRYYRVTAFRHTVSLYAAGAFDSVVFPADDMRVSPTVSWNIPEITNATISGSVNGYQLAFTAVAAGTCIIGGLLTQSAEL